MNYERIWGSKVYPKWDYGFHEIFCNQRTEDTVHGIASKWGETQIRYYKVTKQDANPPEPCPKNWILA